MVTAFYYVLLTYVACSLQTVGISNFNAMQIKNNNFTDETMRRTLLKHIQ